MRFAQDDNMVDTLATDRSDQSFGEAVLPRRAWGNGLVADAHGPLSVPRIRYDNNGDEVRRGPEPMRCGLRAGSRDGSERLCQETDESSARYNRRRISSGREVSALRPRRQYGRHTPDGSIRSIFREAILPRRAWGNGLVADAHGP